MKHLLVVLVIFAVSLRAEPLTFRAPLSLEVPGEVTEGIGPLGVFIKGVMTGSRFDVNFAITQNTMENGTLLSISFRSIGSTIILNSNVKSLSECFDEVNCFLGELPNPPRDTSFIIQQGMLIDLQVIADSMFWHVFFNGRNSLSIRHRVSRTAFGNILVGGGISTSSIESRNLITNGAPPTLRYRSPVLLDINRNLSINNTGPQTFWIRGIRTGASFVFHLTSGDNRFEHNTLVSVLITDTVSVTSNLVDPTQCVSNCTLGQITYHVLPISINVGETFHFHIVTEYNFLQIFIDLHSSVRIPHRIGLQHASNLIFEGGMQLLDVEQRGFQMESEIPPRQTSEGVTAGSLQNDNLLIF